jgi:hypothetical protein
MSAKYISKRETEALQRMLGEELEQGRSYSLQGILNKREFFFTDQDGAAMFIYFKRESGGYFAIKNKQVEVSNGHYDVGVCRIEELRSRIFSQRFKHASRITAQKGAAEQFRRLRDSGDICLEIMMIVRESELSDGSTFGNDIIYMR